MLLISATPYMSGLPSIQGDRTVARKQRNIRCCSANQSTKGDSDLKFRTNPETMTRCRGTAVLIGFPGARGSIIVVGDHMAKWFPGAWKYIFNPTFAFLTTF